MPAKITGIDHAGDRELRFIEKLGCLGRLKSFQSQVDSFLLVECNGAGNGTCLTISRQLGPQHVKAFNEPGKTIAAGLIGMLEQILRSVFKLKMHRGASDGLTTGIANESL